MPKKETTEAKTQHNKKKRKKNNKNGNKTNRIESNTEKCCRSEGDKKVQHCMFKWKNKGCHFHLMPRPKT